MLDGHSLTLVQETKPACLKCTKANVVCGGYEVFRLWTFDSQKHEKPASPPRCLSMSAHSEDWRSFQFFHEKTKPSLALFNSAAEAFWTIVLPQLSSMDDAIRSQIIATASAHELSMGRNHDPKVAKLLISAYSKALKLVAYDQNPQVQIVLTSCLLSIAMDSVQGHFDLAYGHLRSGLAVLREWQNNPRRLRKDPEGIIEQYIEPIFAQLLATFALQYKEAPTLLALEDITWQMPTFPDTFTSIRQARERLAEIGAQMNVLSQRFPGYETYENACFNKVRNSWQEWARAYKAMRGQLTDPREILQWKLMGVQASTHKITFHSYCSPDELRWDEYMCEMRGKVEACVQIASQSESYRSEDYILMDPGVIPPLWMIAIGCRDPILRRRAIALMQDHHRKCGHDDQCILALHAEALMNIEEAELGDIESCQDVPEAQRVRPIAADFGTPGFIRVTFTRSPYRIHETKLVPVPGNQQHATKTLKLWPLSQTMRLAGYQLLIRPEPKGCRCKSFGRDEEDNKIG
jgi:hypothetical protein